MVTFGLDLSHHNSASLDFAQCRREGIEFIFLKSTEGASFVDSAFSLNLAEARAAGQLVAAYHYVRSNATAAAQVDNVRRVVPLDVPVIPDVEANSGGIALTYEIVRLLRAAGYRVPLTYLPRWYWQQIGSPSLAGLPPLWSSRYPDNVVGTIADEWADVPASYWAGYGGLSVAVLQFTSSARIAGYQPLDANAFRGTRQELAAILGGGQEEGGFMADLTEEDQKTLIWRVEAILHGRPAVAGGPHIGEPSEMGRKLEALTTDVAELKTTAGTGGVDLDALADKVAARIGAGLATAISDEIDRRARDNDPTTGPTS